MSTETPPRPPAPTHVLETCLDVRSMAAAVAFYRDILGLKPDIESPRLSMFPLGSTTLILFQLGLTEEDSVSTGANGETLNIPGHGPDPAIVKMLMTETDRTAHACSSNDAEHTHTRIHSLKTHYCLAVSSKEDVHSWEEYLRSKNVIIRGVMEWERGGRSVYFEDADGHIGEIGSKGIWQHW